ncbi:MAG TPA: hypothetical protein VF048_09370, partial [Gemmatimonadaceae bacterium]
VMSVQPAAAAPRPEAGRGTPRTTAAFTWPRATPALTPAAATAGVAAAPPMPRSPTPPSPASEAPPAPPPAAAALESTPAAAPARPTGSVPTIGALARPADATPAFGARRSGGRPINPFLSNDPDQKAKRLARALVSDIVAYHPQLRDQGLREGTLKQLFRDEIKKSYEEYIDQVGKEFAESTTHFQDALNEILAAGRKVF